MTGPGSDQPTPGPSGADAETGSGHRGLGADGSGPDGPADQPATDDRSTPVQPAPPSSNRTTRFAWGAIAVILLAVIVLVIYALTSTTPAQSVAHPSPTAAGIVSQMSTVPAATFDSVGGTPTPAIPTVPPTLLVGQPPLAAGGKPEVLYVGAAFCPFCAAERWPLIVALARFGTFTTVRNMQSSPNSVFPAIQTFTMAGTRYTSRYVTLTGVELYSDATDADGVFTRIASLTTAQKALVARYGGLGSPGTYPFVDIGNRLVTSTSTFSPAILVRLSQATIAGDLAQAQGPPGQAIVAAANQLTVGICLATGQQPAGVCASRGVRAAALTLGPATRLDGAASDRSG